MVQWSVSSRPLMKAGGKSGSDHTALIAKLPLVLPEHSTGYHGTHSGQVILEEGTTQFDLWRPSVGTRVHTQQATQKEGHDVDARDRELSNGTRVLVRDLRDNSCWNPWIVFERRGPLSYAVKLDSGQTVLRHVDHLKRLRSVSQELKEETSLDSGLTIETNPSTPDSFFARDGLTTAYFQV